MEEFHSSKTGIDDLTNTTSLALLRDIDRPPATSKDNFVATKDDVAAIAQSNFNPDDDPDLDVPPPTKEQVQIAYEDAMETFSDVLRKVGLVTDPKPTKTEWTFAVDLTTNFPGGLGVSDRLKTLRGLAEQTKDTNVSFVVQAALPIGIEPTDELFQPAFCRYKLQRYIIENGKIETLNQSYPKGAGEDLQNLLALTCRKFAPNKLGLIIDSHGGGNSGLTADVGKLSTEDLVKSIQTGLKGSNHKKIDFMDLDACLMAQNGVIQRLSAVTDTLVASPETEHIIGQQLSKPLQSLLKKPEMTPTEFANEIINDCKFQLNRPTKDKPLSWILKEPAPIETLTHFDLRRAADFNASLNRFGDQLMQAMQKDEKTRTAIESIIDSSFTYEGKRAQKSILGVFIAADSDGKKTDILDFTRSIVAAIDNKTIEDPTGEIAKSAQQVTAIQQQLVRSYFGYGMYANKGGLSVFLPSKDLRDSEYGGKFRTTAFQLDRMASRLDRTAEPLVAMKALETELKTVETEVKNAEVWTKDPRVVDQVRGRMGSVTTSFKSLQNASGPDYPKSLSEFRKATAALKDSKFFELRAENEEDDAKKQSIETYKKELVTSDSGWDKFRIALRRK